MTHQDDGGKEQIKFISLTGMYVFVFFRYVCLLEALLHHTPVEHQDHKNLKKAIEQIKQVKLLFNEVRSSSGISLILFCSII